MSSSTEKIKTLEEAVRWREEKAGIGVFTNGVFDLIHRGHVELLEYAKGLGDYLIVAINDDDSARGLEKGTGRPIVNVTDRLRVVAGLAATDCVLPFSEPTPEGIIDVMRPDILVKGSDYAGVELPGQRLVESRGGRIVLMPVVPGQSSTTLVERIRGQT